MLRGLNGTLDSILGNEEKVKSDTHDSIRPDDMFMMKFLIDLGWNKSLSTNEVQGHLGY